MAELDDKFKEFLKAYNLCPELTDDAIRESMKEDERDRKIAAAKSDHGSNFEKWKSLPSEIVNLYSGHVPQWILDISKEIDPARLLVLKQNPDIRTRQELDEKVLEEEAKAKQEQSTTEAEARENYQKEREAFEREFEKIAKTVAVIALIDAIKDGGYTEKAAQDLAKERLFRDDLFKKYALGENATQLPEEKRAILRQSRLKTLDLIKKEWKENMPERALIHELSRFNRDKTTAGQAADEIINLVQLIRDNGRFDQLDRYLQHPLVRAKIHQFDPNKPEKTEMLSALDRILFEPKHRQPEERQNVKKSELLESRLSVLLEERDLPFDVKKVLTQDVQNVLGKVKDVQQDANEKRALLAKGPRIRLKVNSNQNAG